MNKTSQGEYGWVDEVESNTNSKYNTREPNSSTKRSRRLVKGRGGTIRGIATESSSLPVGDATQVDASGKKRKRAFIIEEKNLG